MFFIHSWPSSNSEYSWPFHCSIQCNVSHSFQGRLYCNSHSLSQSSSFSTSSPLTYSILCWSSCFGHILPILKSLYTGLKFYLRHLKNHHIYTAFSTCNTSTHSSTVSTLQRPMRSQLSSQNKYSFNHHALALWNNLPRASLSCMWHVIYQSIRLH